MPREGRRQRDVIAAFVWSPIGLAPRTCPAIVLFPSGSLALNEADSAVRCGADFFELTAAWLLYITAVAPLYSALIRLGRTFPSSGHRALDMQAACTVCVACPFASQPPYCRQRPERDQIASEHFYRTCVWLRHTRRRVVIQRHSIRTANQKQHCRQNEWVGRSPTASLGECYFIQLLRLLSSEKQKNGVSKAR